MRRRGDWSVWRSGEEPLPNPVDEDPYKPLGSSKADEQAYLSFFRLSQTFATIAFYTTVDEKRLQCTPAVTLR